MSGPYDHGMNVPVPNMMDPGYSVYDGRFNTGYPRISGPQTHFDGGAFWYNPNNAEPLYDREASLYSGRGVALPATGMEATGIKHRRTRSGCFTCRSRRVKCDETKPICDRCKKGNRDCEFPQPTSTSKRVKQGESRSPKDQTSKHELKEETMSGLATIKDETEDEDEPASTTERPPLLQRRTDSAQSVSQVIKSKTAPDTPPTGRDQASPQSTDVSESCSRDETPASSLRTIANSAEMQARQAKIRSLKPDIQKYLQFQQEYMTYYHYFYKLDPTDFVHGEFIDLALSYEPLLYAVVGFAAYHYELQQPNPKLSHFLGYHSKSLSMLRKSLEKNAKVTEATLLTVLQLATFEEYIGDWVNLVGHHRAAHSMVRELFQHETMMDTDLGRRIFSWCARLDVIVGLMAGNETRLDRQWFVANITWYRDQIDPDPKGDVDIENTLAYFVAANRLIGMDMASLLAKFSKQEISVEVFKAENAEIAKRLDDMKRQIELLNDDYYRVQEFPVEKTRPLTPDDIVNPYTPGGLFKDALWPLNFMWLDWYGIEQMQRYQTAIMLQQPIPPELEQISLEQCRIYEAIERWPDAPNGAILGAHASLGLATVFLKKDARHTMWARRKLAAVERLGYVFPPTFRRKMAEMWGLTRSLSGEDEAVEDWWLPNNEGNIPMLAEIRRVVSDRHENDTMTSMESLASVRDLKAIFAKLDIRTQSTTIPGSTTESLSPLSDESAVNSDRGSNASFSPTSFSPTSGSFGDSRSGSISGQAQGNGQKWRPKHAHSKP
ncbi:uncharacterized protein Z518_08281 [Rhinocladiella mackenziei CBS 650.93]|uniref:Zn(2)-C6 fungal-type domain-containing protein n=1 Tax=Rhinocladiella mackenziei CBS 650.93 TaxID=1442369 RepID=A0A0D2J0C0_9EURO|nr:uncharacterized protein Z518_08281 [Rhinocladiella mackenziei CBS 650.93]KIX02340.1 hypothetical protein Z518_08281 [Rhinocladiella mackenziei CBS 650.93]